MNGEPGGGGSIREWCSRLISEIIGFRGMLLARGKLQS